MNFIALPPEVTSALIHSGPGAGSLLQASAAWHRLGLDVEETARVYAPALSAAAEAWNGRSSAVMIQAVAPYLTWLRSTAQQCLELGHSAQVAAASFDDTLSTVVHPAAVSANRNQLARLLATNGFGRNLPAIAETDAQYQSMWVTNAAALYRYEAASAQALTVADFSSPPPIVNPAGSAAQASAVAAAAAAADSPLDSVLRALGVNFDPNAGWFGLANTYANQFVSSGFPLNLLSYLAQNTSAQALTSVAPDIAEGLSEGEAALGASAASLSGAVRSLSQASAPAAAIGVGVKMGNLTAPPAAVLAANESPVRLVSAVSPLPAGESSSPMLPPLMPPPISAGSGWRKRNQQKYEDISLGKELYGTVMPRPPSAG